MKPSVDDKTVDNYNNLNFELSVSDKKYLICNHVPRRSRTRRVIVGYLKYDPAKGVEVEDLYKNQMMVEENNSSIEGVDKLCRTSKMINEEKNSSEARKRSRDEDYNVCDDDYGEEESSKKKSQKKTCRKPVQEYNLPTDLPQNLQEYINGLNLEVPPLFVAQKLLTVSDITSNLGRLLLPKSLINVEFLDNFLTEAEKETLEEQKAVEVNLVDDMMREYNTLQMAKWAMNSSLPYALRTLWNNVVAENKLKRVEVLKDKKAKTIVVMDLEDDDKLLTDVVVRLWCFRRESSIWFALNMQAMAEVKRPGRTEKRELYY